VLFVYLPDPAVCEYGEKGVVADVKATGDVHLNTTAMIMVCLIHYIIHYGESTNIAWLIRWGVPLRRYGFDTECLMNTVFYHGIDDDVLVVMPGR